MGCVCACPTENSGSTGPPMIDVCDPQRSGSDNILDTIHAMHRSIMEKCKFLKFSDTKQRLHVQ